LKMTNARHFFKFKDEKIQRVADLINYFLEMYGKRYHRLLDQFIKEETILSESPRAEALAVIPAYILCMAYAVVKNDILGEGIVDWYCQESLDAAEKGEYEKELSPLPLPPRSSAKIERVFRQLAPSAD